MIRVVCRSQSCPVGKVVLAAFQRAFSDTQVVAVSVSALENSVAERDQVFVVALPDDEWSRWGQRVIRDTRAKLVVFGSLPPEVAALLGVDIEILPDKLSSLTACVSALPHGFSESALQIVYQQAVAGVESPLPARACVHYDFADEWNNLGFGSVRADASPWALAQIATVPEANRLAEIRTNSETISTYAALWDRSNASVLWFNRLAGPIDSQEWRLVEVFVASYRYTDLPCLPVLSEVPLGYDGAVTMRLDCDEDIESACDLYSAYQEWDVPFSLAIHTRHLDNARHHDLVREVADTGGSILSHSATHPENWGGSYEVAYEEAARSAEALQALTRRRIRYAVSPFHQSPSYAIAALADAGYSGLIGGSIRHNQEFLMARGGRPPGLIADFVGHSQQCMLHGDCILPTGDPLKMYKAAFDVAFRGRALFGYLDHPFSERYQYGWSDESTRIEMHRRLVRYIRDQGRILFMSQESALDFIRDKSRVGVYRENDGFRFELPHDGESPFVIGVEYGGRTIAVADGALQE